MLLDYPPVTCKRQLSLPVQIRRAAMSGNAAQSPESRSAKKGRVEPQPQRRADDRLKGLEWRIADLIRNVRSQRLAQWEHDDHDHGHTSQLHDDRTKRHRSLPQK